VHKACQVRSIREDSSKALSALIKHRKPVSKGFHLYRQADNFDSVYVVQSGAVKTYYINGSGDEHITGLYLPGELFGIDGLLTGEHKYSAEALDTSTFCEINYADLELSFRSHPDIQRRIMEILCSEISERELLSQRQKSADERLATFLTNISDRLKLRGLSPTDFSLPMSRRDIAGYLGVAGETMSRLFTGFQNRGLMSVDGRSVSINDLPSLREMSATSP